MTALATMPPVIAEHDLTVELNPDYLPIIRQRIGQTPLELWL